MGTPVLPLTGQPMPMQPGEFKSLSQPAVVTWRLKDLTPPSIVYIARDDVLGIVVMGGLNGDAVQISGRILTIDMVVVPFVTTVIAATADTLATGSLPLVEGFLLSVDAIATAGGRTDPLFVRVWINRGAISALNTFQELIANYVSTVQRVSWPSMSPRVAAEGPGIIRQLTVGNPAAGADWNFTAGTNHRTTILSARAVLTTSATVANRAVRAQINDGSGNMVWEGPPNQVLPASQTGSVSLTSQPVSSTAVATDIMVSIPSPCILASGWVLQIATTAIQVGDQWSAIRLQVDDRYDQI